MLGGQHDLDEAFRRVSHELRSPLVSLESYMRILLGGVGGEVSERQKEYLDKALLAISDLSRLVEDLLEATRLQSGKVPILPVVGSAATLVEDIVGEFEDKARERGVALTAVANPGLPLLFADPGRVRQILRNLVGNALKFTPSGGSIRVSAASNKEQTRIRFLVRDTGRGMTAQESERIFERLYQVNAEDASVRGGLGLGLFISRDLVERQGGRIWVRSRPGEGSSFFFTLPAVSVPAALESLAHHLEGSDAALALVQLDVTGTGSGLQRAKIETAMSEMHATLEACVMPDRDVVLPRIALPTTDAQRFVVLAAADEAGTQVLVERVRRLLEQIQLIADGSLAVAVTSRQLDVSRPGRLARDVESALREDGAQSSAA